MFYSVSLAKPAGLAHWLAVALILVGLGTANAAPTTSCAGNGTGISLSPGFCASIFADNTLGVAPITTRIPFHPAASSSL